MKKGLKGFLAGALISTVIFAGIPIFASNVPSAFKLTVNSVKIALNGRTIPVDNISYNGSTYVKASQICAILGRDISWDGKTKTVNITDVAPSSTSGSAVVAQPKAGTKNTNVKKNDKDQKNKPATPAESKLEVKSVKALEGGTSVEILFNQKVDKVSAENVENYSFYYAYGSNADVTVYSASLDSTGTKVILTTGGQTATALFTLAISNVKNKDGNVMDNYENKLMGMQSANPTPETGPSKNAPLKIKSITATSPVKVEIVFTKEVEKKSATEAVNYWIYNQNGNKEYLDVAKAELGDSGNTVILTLAKPMANLYYSMDLRNIYDISEKTSVNTTYPFVGHGPCAPYVVSARSLSSNTVEVVFPDQMQKTNIEMVSNYDITSKEGNKNLDIISAKLDDSGIKAILTTGEQENIEYSVHVHNVFSTYTLPLSGRTTVSFQGTGKPGSSKPGVVSVKAEENSNAVEVQFNQKVDKASAENISNYVFGFSYGTKSVVSVSSAKLDSTGTKVTLLTSGQVAATIYDLTISNVKNEAGLIMDGYATKFLGCSNVNIQGNYSVIDNLGLLKMDSCTALSSSTVEITFNKKVDPVTAQDISNYTVYEMYGSRPKVTITKAELSDQNKVILTFSDGKPMILYAIEAKNIQDESGATIDQSKIVNFVIKQ